MQWFQIKEQSAGKKRLLLSWYLYKIFGKKVLYLIAFLMSFFTLVFSPKVRFYSKKYFTVTYPYTKIEPVFKNEFKHVYSYAKSLADRIILYCGDYNSNDIVFENKEDEKRLLNDFKKGKGVFLICSHIGNIEMLQAEFLDKNNQFNFCANMFMSNAQSQIFKDFLDKIKIDLPVKIFSVEDIGINTGINLKKSLDEGNIAYIAGDRVSQNTGVKNIKTKMFNNEILLPKGTFKLAKLMEVPIYFIAAIDCNDHYKIYLEPQESTNEKELASSFVKFLEKMTIKYPFQFFHFYDFFN